MMILLMMILLLLLLLFRVPTPWLLPVWFDSVGA